MQPTQARPTRDPRIDQAAKLLSEYLKSGRHGTDLLRGLAEIIVDLRQSHELKDGRPDLGGRSHAYRTAVREIYELANVTAEEYESVQAAIRYHVNNLLHELHETDELTAAGLGERSARERLAADREQAALIRAALKDPFLLAERIGALAEHIDPLAAAAQPSVKARATRQAYELAVAQILEAVHAIDARFPRRGRSV